MANQWPAPVYTDGDLTTAAAIGLPVFSSPIPPTSTAYSFTQEFCQLLTNWTATPLNTLHPSAGLTPDYSTFFLVAEGERRDMGNGLVRWTRTYAKKPATYDDWEAYSYPFIGYYGAYGPNEIIPIGRPRQAYPVVSRVEHAFYIVGDNAGGGQTGLIARDYATPGSIPVIEQQRYRLTPAGFAWWMDVDFLGNNPPFNIATTPDRTTYEGYCKNAAVYGWAAGTIEYAWSLDGGGDPDVTVTAGTNPGQIVAEDSRLDRWMGNIWLRRTRWVLAK